MTTQILDKLIYQENEHFIYAISGKGLSTPQSFGMVPVELSSACCRGYYMSYHCKDDRLYLNEMTVRTKDDFYPPVEGFYCYRKIADIWKTVTYVGSKLVLSFTGGLVIGRDLRRSKAKFLFVEWSACQKIIELRFENGQLQDEIDCSDVMAKFIDSPYSSEVKSVFSTEYDFMYPWSLT